MGKKIRTARGEEIDFDMMKLKNSMVQTPVKTDVAARKDFIDRKLRRRVKKAAVPAPAIPQETVEVNAPIVAEEKPEKQVFIDANAVEEKAALDVEVAEEEKKPVKTQQKARSRRKT